MMKKKIIVLILLVLMTQGIGIVSAETLTGEIGSTGWNSTNYRLTQTTGGDIRPTNVIIFKDIEKSSETKSLIGWWFAQKPTFDTGAPDGALTSFTAYLANSSDWNYPKTRVIGTGTIGYQRMFNTAVPPVEQLNGYYWVLFDSFDADNLSGVKFIYLDYDHSALYNMTSQSGSSTALGSGLASFGHNLTYQEAGDMTFNKISSVSATYTVTKPAGIGISGYVNKTTNSRIFISDANHTTITSENLQNKNDFIINTNGEQIYISGLSSIGTWYNSTLLFSPGGVTPTPTPGTGEPPAGYVRTIVHVRDRSGAMIHGSNIYIKDVDGNVWSNSTSDADAIHSIDTHPDHVVNFYADFTIFENEFLPGSLLTQYAGSTYYLTLNPWESRATPGNVSLYVEVKDTSGSFIPYANVQIFLPDGYSYAGSTANLGSKVFIVPNETQIRATGTASGYLPGTVIGNSGTSGSTTMLITLSRQFVTTAPTSTIPPGGITPAITIDPNDPALHGGDTSFQGQEMMRYLANNGMTLVQLCFMVTILALLGFKFGK